MLTPSAFFLACLVLVMCFFIVMEEFKKVVDELQRSVKSLQDQVHYQFTCLPFSLSCAPWAFTKKLKPVAAFLRSVGPYCLYRRYPSDRKNTGRSSESHGCLDCSIRGSGFHSQYGEVCVDSLPADQVPGITVEYNQYMPDTPWSQDQDDSERSCSASSPGQLKRAQAYREAECCIPGSFPSPTVLSPPSEGPTRSPSQGQSELRHISSVVSGVLGGG